MQAFGAELWRKAYEYGYQQASLKGFISDGSHWIRGIAEMHFPDAVQILDWYHLCEHISPALGGTAMAPSAPFREATQESRQWASGTRETMKEGKVDETLKGDERLPGRSKNKREAKHELITYLTNNPAGRGG